MATEIEVPNLRLSAEYPPSDELRQGWEAAEPAVSDRRRAVMGLIISLVVVTGVFVWQYFDDQAAFPATAETGDEVPVIGSTSLDSGTATP